MRDQAEGPCVIVLAGGKGGVGTSTLTVLLGAAFARAGRRVLLVDGAQNEGTLHLLLGHRPTATLSEFAAGLVSVSALAQPVAERLALVPAEGGQVRLYAMPLADRARLHLRLTSLYDDYEIVLVDSGAGLESAVRAGAMRAGLLVAVSTPDPVALSLTQALVRIVRAQLPGLAVGAILQQARDDDEARAARARLGNASLRFLGTGLLEFGAIGFDSATRERGARPRGLLAPPDAPLAARIDALSESLLMARGAGVR